MLQELHQHHDVDADGRPAGGHSEAIGLALDWQDGPLGRGDDRREPNGTFVETVIQAAMGRLEFYQSSDFHCIENAIALGHLHAALEVLCERTRGRERREVEGTHQR